MMCDLKRFVVEQLEDSILLMLNEILLVYVGLISNVKLSGVIFEEILISKEN